MKLPPLRAPIFPENGPRWDTVVASVFLIATTASLVSAKTLAFTGAIFVAVLGITQVWRGDLSRDILQLSRTSVLMAAFLGYAALTLLWTPNFTSSLTKLLAVTAYGLAALFGVRTIASQSPPRSARLGESLAVGLAIGSVYLVARNVTRGHSDDAMLPHIASQFVKFDLDEMTRSIAPVTLLLGPTLLAVAAGFRKPWNTMLSVVLFIASTLAIVTSPHETSKIALAVWILIFGLAYLSQNATFRILQIAWLAACLLVVPLSIFCKSRDFQDAPWLQQTAQYRILIWNKFAELVLQRPVAGYGFDATAASMPEVPGLTELRFVQKGLPVPDGLKPFRAVHPHNAYLQVWYELGAIGIGLFIALGLSMLNSLSRLRPHKRPYLYASAAATMVMLYSSYGLWQLWLIGMLCFVAIAASIAIKLSTARSSPDTA